MGQAWVTNAVGIKWVMLGLRMQWVWNGSRLGYECSGYGMGQAWVTNAVGMEWVTPGLRMQWVWNGSSLDYNAVGIKWVKPGLQMQWVWNGSRLGYECSGYRMGHAWVTEDALQLAGRKYSNLLTRGYYLSFSMGAYCNKYGLQDCSISLYQDFIYVYIHHIESFQSFLTVGI